MKPIFIGCSFLVTLLSSPASGDMILFQNGERQSCLIQGVDGRDILVQSRSTNGSTPILARVSKSDIKGIEFEPDAGRDSFIREATASQIPQLRSMWLKLSPLIKHPASPVSRLGLRLGVLLLESKDSSEVMEADHLFSLISKEGPKIEEREAAKQGILRSLIRRGLWVEAAAEADRFLKLQTGPGLEAEARLVAASAAEKALRRHLDEHPRWQRDPFAKSDHLALFNRALNLYLQAALIPNAPADLALRGLWGALELNTRYNHHDQALEIARDLVAFYPKSAFAERARAYLAQQGQTAPSSVEAEDISPPRPLDQLRTNNSPDEELNTSSTPKDNPRAPAAPDSLRR